MTELKRLKSDLSAMKSQSEGLHKEYDRLLEERTALEVKVFLKNMYYEFMRKYSCMFLECIFFILQKKLESGNGEDKKDR